MNGALGWLAEFAGRTLRLVGRLLGFLLKNPKLTAMIVVGLIVLYGCTRVYHHPAKPVLPSQPVALVTPAPPLMLDGQFVPRAPWCSIQYQWVVRQSFTGSAVPVCLAGAVTVYAGLYKHTGCVEYAPKGVTVPAYDVGLVLTRSGAIDTAYYTVCR